MFHCSFSTLPPEILLNPFYWNKEYAGVTNYITCAKAHNITKNVVSACYKVIPRKCQFPTSDNADLCYQSLQRARRKAAQPSLVGNQRQKNKFLRHMTCLSTIYKQLSPCISILEHACQSGATRAVKVIRFSLSFASGLLTLNPAIKIIHLVRDPRGMLLSSQQLQNRTLTVKTATTLCKRIVTNIQHFKLLAQNFPRAVYQLRYEDLSTNLRLEARDVYGFTNFDQRMASEYLNSWWDLITNPTNNTGTFNTYRLNSTAEAYDWMSKLNTADRKLIESAPECNEVIRVLQYPKIQ